METVFVAVLISFVLGILGHMITKFWLCPIIRYRRIKRQIASDLIFHLNATNTEAMGKIIGEKTKEKIEANRQHSVKLSESYSNDLPSWYKWFLDSRGESPIDASQHLLVLSNTLDYEYASRRVEKIRKYLKIK